MRNLTNTALLSASALTLLGSCKQAPSETQTQKKPNILFIMADDHTSQAWGIYGGILKDYVKNDNLKRLAKNGVVLDNCFCTNSISSPSRACILSGQYSHKNKVYTLREPLVKGARNIAHELKDVGYQTAIVGKWHLDKMPQGFDYFNVLPGQGYYHDPILKTKEYWQDGYKGGVRHKGFSTDVIADLAIDWMDKTDSDKPFMMMCHFKATHEPYDFPERHKNFNKDVVFPEPESLYDFGKETTGRTINGQSIDNLGTRWEKATAAPDKWWCHYPELPFSRKGLDKKAARHKTYQKLIRDFTRCGAAIDDNIGKLLDYLEKTGKAENTIVIYTADQGYFLGEHGFFDKRLIYEESLRMPFVISYPKDFKGGKRIDDIILNIDFPALIADYAGIKRPEYMQGKSFRNILKGKTPTDWRKSLYYRYWLHSQDRPGHFGVRSEKYTLAFFYGQGLGMNGAEKVSTKPSWEFYDLEKDPHQLKNEFNNPKYAEVIKELKKEILEKRIKYDDRDKEFPIMKEIIQKEFADVL
jgi:arylsulfatase A-like enzyme